MIKQTSLFLLLILSSFTGMSQSFTYEVSEPFPLINAKEKIYFSKGDQLMAVKVNPGFVVIQKWDAETMNETSTNRYDKIIPGFRFECMQNVLGHYYFFYSAFEKSTLSERLFVKEIDFESGEFTGEEKLILTVDGKVNGPFGGLPIGLDIKKFNIQTSPNETFVMIQYRKAKAARAKSLGPVGLCVLDSENLERVWSREIELPSPERVAIKNYLIDDNGKVFLCTIKESEHGDYYNINDLVYTFVVFIITQDLELTEVPLNFNENISVYKIKSFMQKNGQITFTGNYRESKEGSTQGLVYSTMNENLEFSPLIKIKFTDEVLMIRKKSKKKGAASKQKIDDEIYSLEVRLLKLNEEGQANIIIAEKEVHWSESHFNKDIVVAKFDNNNNVLWMKKLSKSQRHAVSSPYVIEKKKFFKYYYFEKFHYFLFLDGAVFTLYKIDDESGEVEKIPLANTDSINNRRVSQFELTRTIWISNNEIIIGAYNGKKEDVLIKAKF